MAVLTETTNHWWAVPAPRQVSFLRCVDPELISIALDPLPDGAPLVLRFRPASRASLDDQIEDLLAELDRAAIALFPRWLPGAERLERSTQLGVPAVRSLAARSAAHSPHFGPFLADLAERGLLGSTGGRPRFPSEVRAAGLARVIMQAYVKSDAVVLVEVPDGLAARAEDSLVRAYEWLADRGRLTVWLAGAPLRFVDRVHSVEIILPPHVTQLANEAGERFDLLRATTPPSASFGEVASMPTRDESGPALSYPPIAGMPRSDSPAEQALEQALAPHEWANGRLWNHTYDWHTLGSSYRLDLFWPSEGVVVEVDGPEHRGRLSYADDRRRDVKLQLLGHDVLRFTNEQVLSDVDAVATTIRQLLSLRRRQSSNHANQLLETRQHVNR